MDFLFEIGTEEIPAGYIAGAVEQLVKFFQKGLDEAELSFDDLQVFDTPRRMAILLKGLPEGQQDKVVEKIGPKVEVAYAEDGKSLSNAGMGFLRSSGCDESQVFVVESKKGKNIAVKFEQKGQKTSEILSQLCTECVSAINYPKSMKWGSESFLFARPVRWLVALLDDEVVSVEIAGVKSGRVTNSHREFGGKHELATPSDYEAILLSGRVIASRKKRFENVLHQFNELDLEVVEDNKLMNLVCDIVEYPVVMVGEFDEKFLELPEKIIITTLCEHQKCFATRKNGKLTNKFVFVSNGKKENSELIIVGNQKVAKARLSDAKFFYTEDTKKPLADYYQDLEQVTFQQDLGSLLSKVQRVEKICSYLAERLAIENTDSLDLAAKLSKCDLVTTMLGEKEFTKLQGYMGHQYALATGVDASVALAIEEHYLPKGLGGDLPTTDLGAILAIADKIDTICGIVGIGMLPTGSADPFALRRAATGICRIILDRNLDFDLVALVQKSFALQPDCVDRKHIDFVVDYLMQRVKYVFSQNEVKDDLLVALLGDLSEMNLAKISKKIAVLQPMLAMEEFLQLVLSCKRIDNILISAKPEGKVAENLLTEEMEVELYNFFQNLKLSEIDDFEQKIAKLIDFTSVINRFFDKIMVNAEDEKIKKNRWNLLAAIREEIKGVMDFGKIETGELK